MYCPKCNRAMDPELPTCKYCGFINRDYDYKKDRTFDGDYIDMKFNILGLLIPIMGIILYFINKDKKPKMSKSILKYTVFGIVIYCIFIILFNFVF